MSTSPSDNPHETDAVDVSVFGAIDPETFVPYVMIRDTGAEVMRINAAGLRAHDSTLVIVLSDKDGRGYTVEVPAARVTIREPDEEQTG